MSKKYWLGPGTLSNPDGAAVKPDEQIPAALVKKMGADRIGQLEKAGQIADQPRTAIYAKVAENTQKALKISNKELGAANEKIVRIEEELEKLKSKNKKLETENASLKAIAKDVEKLKVEDKKVKNLQEKLKIIEEERNKAVKELNEKGSALQTLKNGYNALKERLKEKGEDA